MSTIGFIGLGNMGAPMAANLARAGHAVRGFDLAAAAVDAVGESRIAIARSPADAAAGAAMVITMLPSGRHVLDVYTEALTAASPGTLFIDCSTIDVGSAREAHALAAAAGMVSIDAPVSGGTSGAADATLTFMAGGADEAITRAETVLLLMGRRVVACGGPGAGQSAKICNNMVLGVSMVAASEAFVLGETLGLTHQALYEVLSTSSGQCWSVTSNCPVPGPLPTSPASRGYAPGFMAKLMLKDMKLAAEAGDLGGVDIALGRQAGQVFEAMVASGAGEEDFSAVIKAIRARSGDPAS